jgi:hypothetical protein
MITPAKCSCGSDEFIIVYGIGIVSALAPGNRTGKEGFVMQEKIVCRQCNKPAPVYRQVPSGEVNENVEDAKVIEGGGSPAIITS